MRLNTGRLQHQTIVFGQLGIVFDDQHPPLYIGAAFNGKRLNPFGKFRYVHRIREECIRSGLGHSVAVLERIIAAKADYRQATTRAFLKRRVPYGHNI